MKAIDALTQIDAYACAIKAAHTRWHSAPFSDHQATTDAMCAIELAAQRIHELAAMAHGRGAIVTEDTLGALPCQKCGGDHYTKRHREPGEEPIGRVEGPPPLAMSPGMHPGIVDGLRSKDAPNCPSCDASPGCCDCVVALSEVERLRLFNEAYERKIHALAEQNAQLRASVLRWRSEGAAREREDILGILESADFAAEQGRAWWQILTRRIREREPCICEGGERECGGHTGGDK